MADHITITADHDGSLERGSLNAALSGLDVSVSSPVSASGREVGAAIGDYEVTLSVSGHDGEFTKTSQTALTSALSGLDAVDADSVAVEGGYEPDDAADDSDDGE